MSKFRGLSFLFLVLVGVGLLTSCTPQIKRRSITNSLSSAANAFSINELVSVNNSNSVNYSGSCVSPVTQIQISGIDNALAPCTSELTWSYTTIGRSVDGDYSYQFQALSADNTALGFPETALWLRDTIAPTLSLSSPSGTYYGGSSLGLTFSASDNGSGVAGVQLFYAADGATYHLIGSPTVGTNSFNWTVPLDNVTTARLKIVATDLAGNVSSAVTSAFTVQSIAPNPPLVTLVSNSPTNSSAVLLTITDCTGRPYVLVNEGAQPTSTSSGWVSCSSAHAATTYTLSSTVQGTHSVNVWVKDSVGNISTAPASVNIIFDNIAPVIVLGALPNPASQGSSVAISWTTTEATVSPTVSFLLNARQNSSSAWSSIGSVSATFGPLSSAPFSFNWTVPNWVTSTAQIQVILTDLAGNTGITTSSPFTVAPNYPNVAVGSVLPVIAGGAAEVFTLSASTTVGNITSVVLGYASDGVTFNSVMSWTPNTASFSTSYSWTAPSSNVSTAKLRLTAINTAGNSAASTSSTFTVDSLAPTLTATQLKVNGGATTVSSNQIQVSLQSTDNLTNILKFCLKSNDSSAPALTDSCWQSVTSNPPALTPSPTLSLSNFPFQIGFSAGTYIVYAWTQDQAGNISSLSNAGSGTEGQDRLTLTYSPSPAPIVANIQAASSDTPQSPPDPILDLQIAPGAAVYLKWKATGTSLPANPISLFYTSDGSTFHPIATSIANGQTGSCTLESSHTGCYVWTGGSPSGSFNIRVCASDANGNTSCSFSTSLNSAPFNIIAGNMDPGTGTAATSAIFFSNLAADQYGDPGSMVVTPNGTIYFKDAQRGIMEISPSNGKLVVLIPKTGVVHDGTLSSATVNNPFRIALDFSGRLLIYDVDRIRAVNFATNSISTLIGGGTLTTDGTSGEQYQIPAPSYNDLCGVQRGMLLVPLPNGDLWFNTGGSCGNPASGSNTQVKIYHASTDEVTTFSFSGSGSYQQDNSLNDASHLDWYNQGYLQTIQLTFNPTSSAVDYIYGQFINTTNGVNELNDVSFNPSTGVAFSPHPQPNYFYGDNAHINSPSGDLYSLTRGSGVNSQSTNLSKFNRTNKTWIPLLGTNQIGHCSDGTLATSCAVDLWDAYVTAQGTIYILDHGQIRVIDSSGKLLTLFGQSRSFGDGGDPLSARFNALNWINQTSSGEIIVKDDSEFKLRSFSVGGSTTTLAGNGSESNADTVHPANSQGFPVASNAAYFGFAVDSSTGDIFATRDQFGVSRLVRSSGLWVDIAGNGAGCYTTGDGSTINLQYNYCSDPANNGYSLPDGILGYNGTQILRSVSSTEATGPYAGPGFDGYLKLYDVSTGIQSTLAGAVGTIQDWVNQTADGTLLSAMPTNRNLNYYNQPYYDAAHSRWLMSSIGSSAIRILIPSQSLGTLATLPRGAQSFTYRVNANAHELLYYCSAGLIYRYDVNTTSETLLPWTVSTASCTGHSLFWNATRSTITFPFTENGLEGIAEIKDTP